MVAVFKTFPQKELENVRQEVLASARGEMLNIFNHDKFGRFFSLEHVTALLQRAETMKVIYVASDAQIDPRLLPFVHSGKLKIYFLPISEFNFATEILITAEKTFIATGDGRNIVIENSGLAADMRIMFHALEEQAMVYTP